MIDAEKQALLSLLVEQQVLKFGDFVLKSGRRSPYFFNLGAINSGATIAQLGEAYAGRILSMDRPFDTVFGPAYKGIPIAVSTSEALARCGRNVGWAFNRKEAKDHGEGGEFVGADVGGRLILVDDVLTAGTALREAADLLKSAGSTLVGVVIALDRQELLEDGVSTGVERLSEELQIPVTSLLNLHDVIEYLDLGGVAADHPSEQIRAIKAYQAAYCRLQVNRQ